MFLQTVTNTPFFSDSTGTEELFAMIEEVVTEENLLQVSSLCSFNGPDKSYHHHMHYIQVKNNA